MILLAGVEPLVLLDRKFEGALRDVAPAYKFHHVVAERGCGSFELEAKSILICRECECPAGGAGENGVDVVIEAHNHIRNIALGEGIAVDFLTKPTHDGL